MAMVLKEEKYTISKSGNSMIRDFLATTVAVIWKLFLWLVVYDTWYSGVAYYCSMIQRQFSCLLLLTVTPNIPAVNNFIG